MSDEKWLRQAAEDIRKEGHYGWGNTCEQGADRIAELEARELGWLTTLSSMELEARQLRAENQRLRCSHDWQVVDAHSEDCRVCGESRLSPLGGGE